MLKRIYVHNFRSLVNFEWDLPTTSVLVGDNGAGKSALIEVLWLLQDVLIKGDRIDETVAPAARTVWLSDDTQSFEIDLEMESVSLRYRLDVDYRSRRPAIHEVLRAGDELLYRSMAGKVELFGDSPTGDARTVIPFDRSRSFLSVLESRPDNRRLIAFREAIASIWAIKPDPTVLGEAAVSESVFLDRNLRNFASWYRSRMQEEREADDALREDLRRVIPGFSALRLVRVSSEVRDLTVQFSFGGKTHELGWAKLSDGQRLLIAMYGMLRLGFSHASLIALDECENYVAPGEIQPWLQAVVDAAAERGQQLLVVSHHPESIDYLAADEAWGMWRDREAGHTRIRPLMPDRDAGETAYDLVKFAFQDEAAAGVGADDE